MFVLTVRLNECCARCLWLPTVHADGNGGLAKGNENSFQHFSTGARDVMSSLRHVGRPQQQQLLSNNNDRHAHGAGLSLARSRTRLHALYCCRNNCRLEMPDDEKVVSTSSPCQLRHNANVSFNRSQLVDSLLSRRRHPHAAARNTPARSLGRPELSGTVHDTGIEVLSTELMADVIHRRHPRLSFRAMSCRIGHFNCSCYIHVLRVSGKLRSV